MPVFRGDSLLDSVLFPRSDAGVMSDKSDLKAELERKKQRLAQIREEKKRKEEERKKKEVRKNVSTAAQLLFQGCVRVLARWSRLLLSDCVCTSRRIRRRGRRLQRIPTWIASAGKPRRCSRVLESHPSRH